LSRDRINALRTAIDEVSTGPVNLMEVCGSHTMAISRFGIRSLLPNEIRLISGPGCPVCVTEIDYIDQIVALSRIPGTLIATYGDLLRVPGTHSHLGKERVDGADIRIVYSAMQALEMARDNPGNQVIFCGIGFETTTPATAVLIRTAVEQKFGNLTVLCAHKTMKPAMNALLESGSEIDGFLCPGHVSVITGMGLYEELCRDYPVACTVAGFEAEEILLGLFGLVKSIQSGRNPVRNAYPQAVSREGNRKAREIIDSVFEPRDAVWRGLGSIPGSGLAIRSRFSAYDAARRFEVRIEPGVEPYGCRCGDILRGMCEPGDCPLFGTRCTPDDPVGACMVSSEGTCAAWYIYGGNDGRS
jgi:hydrogenase expression/formation protein HypD